MYKTSFAAMMFMAFSVAHAAEPTVNTGARLWAKCSACHSAQAGVQGMLGPNLHGVVGRKAASLEGYAFSPALKNSNIVWDAQTLDMFLKSPQEKVPGTRMAFSGLKDAKERAALIRHLSNQSK